MSKKAVLLGMLVLLVGVVRGQSAPPERFLLTFIPNIQFSPVYVAMASGYMEEAGFDLTLEYLNEPDVVDLIAAGQANFGIVSGEQVILASVQGREVLYVYNWFNDYPVGVVVRSDGEIQSPEDLRGARVGIPGRFGASYSGLIALLRANGLTEADIQLEEIGFNAPEVFCLGVLQAAVVYVNNEPLQIQSRADAGDCGDVTGVQVFNVTDQTPLVSNGIITSKAFAESQPEQVAAFVAAYHRGLLDVINNPAQAYLLSEAFVENLPLTEELRAFLETVATEQSAFLETNPTPAQIASVRSTLAEVLHDTFDSTLLLQFDVLLSTIALWEREGLGQSDPLAWSFMVETLSAMGMVTPDLDPSNLYTNDFVPDSD